MEQALTRTGPEAIDDGYWLVHQLVLGATCRTWLAVPQPTTTMRSRVIRRGGGIGVHIVPCPPTANGVPSAACGPDNNPNIRRRTMMQQKTSWPGRLRLAARWTHGRAVPGAGRRPQRISWLASAGVVAAALIVAACGSSGSGGPGSTPSHAAAPASGMAASGSALKTATINGATVLTNARGFTLYSFAPDTPTKSNCNGTCAQNWPPVKGPATASGVTGKFGIIKRSDGSTQATFDGHPLYTFVGDTAPGQNKGNGLNAAGGLWHELATSGTAAPAGSSSSGSGGGYGY
jgi:predicted lipoprotein with Yx(FWY)xxD motif